jgi:predicted phage tail protein
MPLDNDQLNEKIHGIDLDVSVLKRDNEIQTKILDKLDRTVDGIHELAQSMHRMVSIHEEKFATQAETNDRVDLLIEENRKETKEAMTQAIEKIEAVALAVEELKTNLILNKDEKPKSDKVGFGSIIDWFISYWKIIAFAFAFAAGIITHKWGIFAALFNS